MRRWIRATCARLANLLLAPFASPGSAGGHARVGDPDDLPPPWYLT